MNGVDQVDKAIAHYPFRRKTRKWPHVVIGKSSLFGRTSPLQRDYHFLFVDHLINICALQSHTMETVKRKSESVKPRPYVEFLDELADQLLNIQEPSRQRPGRKRKGSFSERHPTPRAAKKHRKLNEHTAHLPQAYDPSTGHGQNGKRCVICGHKSRAYCSHEACGEAYAVCLPLCFRERHL